MSNTLKKLLAALLALCLLLGCAALAEPAEAIDEPVEANEEAPADANEEASAYTVEGRTYPYLRQFSDAEKYPTEDEMTLYFINGGDIPYVALSEYMPFLSGLFRDLGKGNITYEITRDVDNEGVFYTVSRPDNYSMMFLYTDMDMLLFDNFNSFTQTVGTKALVSTLDMPEADEIDPVAYIQAMLAAQDVDSETQEQVEEIIDAESEGADDAPADDAPAQDAPEEADDEPSGPSLFALKTSMYVNRAGNIISLSLSEYDIDIIDVNGECYIPFQTLNDLLVSDVYMQYVFDGEKVLGAAYGCSLLDEMDSAPKGELSKEFAMFNYNELRLLLDCMYGLKPEHGIDNFDTFLSVNTGLWSDLTNTDAMRAGYALAKLLYMYFDDQHSGLVRSSYQFERNALMDQLITVAYLGPSTRKSVELMRLFSDARKAVYRAWVPGYEEVGDTAFITFDKFTATRSNYFDQSIDRDDPQDTIDLIIYANSQIKREGSPIKNIVLDLSNNGGGNSNAAIFVISWFLGEADIALRDTFTGAETNAIYLADVNLDGQFDDADNVGTGYKLYCLTTNNSFSCGNLVPAACRSSGKVTLVGQTSGGGSCVVLPCTTAAGAVFQMSGNKQISIIKNGSFYNADTGIVPDFPLDKPESYYDRPALMEYLRNLK